MKSILLASVATVGFAGVAAADVSFSGEASASYNNYDGFFYGAELTAGMSQALNNGLTAAVDITVTCEYDNDCDVNSGAISITGESAGITIGYGIDNAAEAAGLDGILNDDDMDGASGFGTFGSASVYLSYDVMTEEIVAAVSASLGMANVIVGFNDAGDYDADISATLGSADVSFGFDSNNDWDLSVSAPVGPVTLSASTDESSNWEIGADYDNGAGITAGLTFDAANYWEVTVGYAAGAIAVDASLDADSYVTLIASYDMGNGLSVLAGYADDGAGWDGAYVGAEYDLGAGASVTVSYATSNIFEAEELGAEYIDGATVEVSLAF